MKKIAYKRKYKNVLRKASKLSLAYFVIMIILGGIY
jgi:hypothetical protein